MKEQEKALIYTQLKWVPGITMERGKTKVSKSRLGWTKLRGEVLGWWQIIHENTRSTKSSEFALPGVKGTSFQPAGTEQWRNNKKPSQTLPRDAPRARGNTQVAARESSAGKGLGGTAVRASTGTNLPRETAAFILKDNPIPAVQSPEQAMELQGVLLGQKHQAPLSYPT